MEFDISPFPCMPIPMIPKRTRSLGATSWGIAHAGVGSSRMALLATVAPAAEAVREMKSRREKSRVIEDLQVRKLDEFIAGEAWPAWRILRKENRDRWHVSVRRRVR